MAQELQRDGRWRHLWRIAGRYANVSVFDVADHAALHDTLIDSCPCFPTWKSKCRPLCRHASSIHEDDR